MRRSRRPTPMAAALVLSSLLVAACSSDDAGTATTSSPPSTAAVEATVAVDTSTNAGVAAGTIAGVPFSAGSQYVQFDTLGGAWRLYVLSGSHGCDEELASLRPAISVTFPVAPGDGVPAPGPVDGLGVTFVHAERAESGPLTVTSGTSFTLSGSAADPGGRWTGILRVDPFAGDGGTYSVDVAVDAVVCPPSVG